MRDDADYRRKRLSYRSWHRGTKELDLLIGSFADRYLPGMSEDQLDRFEALLEVPEPLLYDWLTGKSEPAGEHDTDVARLLIAYRYEPAGL